MQDQPSSSSHTTALLLQRIRNGDRDARGRLVARLQPFLTRFAHGRLPKLLRHDQDTLDLVQSTWLKVLDKLEQIDCPEPGMFFGYLRTVLLNSLRESLRRQVRAPFQAHEAPELLPAADSDPADWIAYEQLLSHLEPEYQVLVTMRFEFGMSFVEMAEELDQSPDGIRMKLGRVIARMAAQS